MAHFILNEKTIYAVTAPADTSADLSVTIGTKVFTESFDTDEATTVDNFIVSFGNELNDLGILAYDSGNVVAFYGLGQRFSTSNTFVEVNETLTPPAEITSTTIDSADNLSITVSTGGTNTATYLGKYHDNDTRDTDRVRLLALSNGKDPLVRPNSASRWSLSS